MKRRRKAWVQATKDGSYVVRWRARTGRISQRTAGYGEAGREAAEELAEKITAAIAAESVESILLTESSAITPRVPKQISVAFVEKHPKWRQWASHIRSRYGLSIADYCGMLSQQGGVCAICGTDAPGSNGLFVVDHDHETGAVRGLLCRNCNSLLGNAKESVSILAWAACYIRASKLCDKSITAEAILCRESNLQKTSCGL